MATLRSVRWRWILVAVLFLAPHISGAQEGDADVESVFFEALDLKEAGQCGVAVGRFQLCLKLDPTLHQARLHLAECFLEIGEHEAALREATAYLGADFPEAEADRAQAVVSACEAAGVTTDGGKPVEPTPPVQDDPPTTDKQVGDGTKPPTRTGGDAGYFPGDSPRRWSSFRVGAGLLVTHFANEAKLTALGPLVDLRITPGQYVEFGLTARVAMGPYAERGGTVTVPQFGVAAGVSIPLKGPRLTIGALIPLVLSQYDGETVADGGILGEVGIHIPLGSSPVVLDGVFEGGYLVTGVVGGRIGVSFQIGPRRLK